MKKPRNIPKGLLRVKKLSPKRIAEIAKRARRIREELQREVDQVSRIPPRDWQRRFHIN